MISGVTAVFERLSIGFTPRLMCNKATIKNFLRSRTLRSICVLTQHDQRIKLLHLKIETRLINERFASAMGEVDVVYYETIK